MTWSDLYFRKILWLQSGLEGKGCVPSGDREVVIDGTLDWRSQ